MDNNRAPEVPEELQRELVNVMANIASWVVANTNADKVLTEIHCIHDCDTHSSSMRIDIGVSKKRAASEPARTTSPQEVADKVIADMMRAAKDRGVQDTKPQQQEPPKPEGT